MGMVGGLLPTGAALQRQRHRAAVRDASRRRATNAETDRGPAATPDPATPSSASISPLRKTSG